MKKTKWAVAGPGFIANRFARGLLQVPDAQRAAVVSRSEKNAEAYAEQYGFESCYTDFGKMLREVKPDVVYVATPNDVHMDYVAQALSSGVAVLCEKPMADNTAQLEKMIQLAKDNNTFLMEAMWTRCFPAVQKAREWLQEGKIGDVMTVHSFLSLKLDPNDWQLWKTTLAHTGGSLRDLGVYVLAMAILAFPQEPKELLSFHRSNGEVDVHADMLFRYEGDKAAYLTSGFAMRGNPVTTFFGEKGAIAIGPDFSCPSQVTFIPNQGEPEVLDFPYSDGGMQFEAMRVQECLAQGLLECPDFTWDDSRKVCAIVDRLRKEWGIRYATDE